MKQIITILSLISFLFLTFATLPTKAQELSYYEKVEVVFTKSQKPEPPKETIQLAEKPVEEVKKVDFLVPVSSETTTAKAVSKKKAITKVELEEMPLRYETGKLPEFPISKKETVNKESYSKEEVIELIKYYSALYRGDENRFLKIAKCESGYNENAYNPAGPYFSVFQFLPSTANANSKRLLKENPNAFDGETFNINNAKHNVHLAIWMMQVKGQWHQWGCAR